MDLIRVVVYALALVGFVAVVLGLLSIGRSIKWCPAEGCSVQGSIEAISSSLATIFAFAAVVVALQALRVQRNASEAELRAYIFLDRAEYVSTTDSIEIALRNCGGTPALNLDIVLDLQLVEDRESELEVSFDCAYPFGAIGPDKYQTLDWPEVCSKRSADLEHLHSKSKHICVAGWIAYDDIFGVRHRLKVQTALTSDGKEFRKKLDIIRQVNETPALGAAAAVAS
ncbi:hypothetical protein MPLB_1820044 [Mesorhizobium sp. ORS 3324]|nr:hypothetical protein MPLB_1820044 [Mesorhizobium sp. ORS 3324]